jgi:hypothetical protein
MVADVLPSKDPIHHDHWGAAFLELPPDLNLDLDPGPKAISETGAVGLAWVLDVVDPQTLAKGEDAAWSGFVDSCG